MHLILCPLKQELLYFVQALESQAWSFEKKQIQGKWYWQNPDIIVALGGHGKLSFQKKTEYWLSEFPEVDGVIAIGSAGSLSPRLAVGDVLGVTDIIEHQAQLADVEDEESYFFKTHLDETSSVPQNAFSDFQFIKGRITSGDEDITSQERAEQIRQQTGALSVCWESSGGALGCQPTSTPYLEFRGITDLSGCEAHNEFIKNLPRAMKNCARVVEKILK